MPFRTGTDDEAMFIVKGQTSPPQILTRPELVARISAVARYALRATMMNGQLSDFDPDALVQNVIIGMLGYHTPDGLGDEPWMNPPWIDPPEDVDPPTA